MLAALLVLAPTGALPIPLEAKGPWTVAYEENMCLGLRRYGPLGETQVAFRPQPLSERMEVSYDVRRWPARLRFRGEADLRLSPADQRFVASYVSNGRNALILYTATEVLDRAQEGNLLSVATRPFGAVAVRLTNLDKLRAALADCRKVLLRHWGVDLDALAAVATPPRSVDPARWITADDYPRSARGKGGTSVILWTVGTDGGVSSCRTVGRSGVPELDEAACAAITRRGRFEPARDARGRAIPSYISRRVRWSSFAY